MWFRKKVKEVPLTNATKEVEAVQLWEVEWKGRDGPFSSDVRREWEVFTSEEQAAEFAESLRRAFKLLRITSDTEVTMRIRS
jgi:hypothetical protein